MQTLEDIQRQAEAAIQAAPDLKSLDQLRVNYLGKKGQLTEYLKTLGQLPPEERPIAGQKINAVKVALQTLIEKCESNLKQVHVAKQLSSETIDITLPGRTQSKGSIHPVTQTCADFRRIFSELGFSFTEGPEIEDDYHNFTALNFPPLHPARAMHDTFYFPNGTLLRTHTSPIQIRCMKNTTPPLRIVAMGRVYRSDFDLTHTPMFHQIETLMIDEHITFADLKGLMTYSLQAFFEDPNLAIRFRPSFFPFTEPSAEVDIGCLNCKGKGCRICKFGGYLEVLGCGMVHPNVLTMADIDSERYRGFASGAGIDRLALLKYRVTDLRALFDNDLRFLNQF